MLAPASVKIESFHGNQIDNSLVLVFQPNRDLHKDGVLPEFFFELVLYFERIGTDPVALIYKGQPGDLVAFKLPVYGQSLGLDAAHGAEDQDRSVQDPEGTLDFYGKIHVSRRVDDIERMVLPMHICGSRGNGNASLPFQFHGIHGSADTVFSPDFMNGIDLIAIEQDPLGQGSFTRIDVGADTYISHFGQICLHYRIPRWVFATFCDY